VTETARPEVPFAVWLRSAVATLEDDQPAEVPCGECNACCRTHHYIHVRPEEKHARARLPRGSLSPAPGLPPGYLVIGPDDAGCCPLLADGRCTMYDDRPLACRTYDCRMYAATGVSPDRADIAEQVRRWRFAYPAPDDCELQAAVLAAARFIREHPESLASDAARRQPIRVATLAVAIHAMFLAGAVVGARRRPAGDRERVLAVADANERLFGDG
jgi:Fe-S-cluster containining protein